MPFEVCAGPDNSDRVAARAALYEDATCVSSVLAYLITLPEAASYDHLQADGEWAVLPNPEGHSPVVMAFIYASTVANSNGVTNGVTAEWVPDTASVVVVVDTDVILATPAIVGASRDEVPIAGYAHLCPSNVFLNILGLDSIEVSPEVVAAIAGPTYAFSSVDSNDFAALRFPDFPFNAFNQPWWGPDATGSEFFPIPELVMSRYPDSSLGSLCEF